MNSDSKKDKSKAAFLVELDKMPGVQIQELPEEDNFMVFYPKEQHRTLASHLNLGQTSHENDLNHSKSISYKRKNYNSRFIAFFISTSRISTNTSSEKSYSPWKLTCP
jgi:hypothetical protein